MTFSLAVASVLGFFVHIDAQKSPVSALVGAAGIGLLLWFIVAQSRRREERRAEVKRDPFGRRSRDR